MAEGDIIGDDTVVCCQQKVPLKTGTICLGITQILFYGFILVLCILTAADVLHGRDGLYFSQWDEKSKRDYLIWLSIAAVMLGTNIICGALLSYGAKKENPALIRPWQRFQTVFIMVVTSLYIAAAVSLFRSGDKQMGYATIFLILFDLGKQTRGMVLVKTYLKKLKESDGPTTGV